MKKAIITLLIVAFFFATPTFAEKNNNNIYELGNITIIFSDETIFSIEDRQVISQRIVDESDYVQKYNLLCSLFSHKYESEAITTITHKVRSTAPRCCRSTYYVSVCSRCGNTKKELLAEDYINCCK